jgi:WD40 repeat protein
VTIGSVTAGLRSPSATYGCYPMGSFTSQCFQWTHRHRPSSWSRAGAEANQHQQPGSCGDGRRIQRTNTKQLILNQAPKSPRRGKSDRQPCHRKDRRFSDDQPSRRPPRRSETDGAYCASFATNQRRALSGSRDGTVRVWDLKTGHCLRVIEAHTYHIQCLVWSADQTRALSCSRDIRLWDIDAGCCLNVFGGEADTLFRSVEWSADQRRVLSASHDRTVRLWDVETGRCLRALEGHEAAVINAVWCLDQRRVISCDERGSIRVRDP